MSEWRIRRQGSPESRVMPDAPAILQGILDGDWDVTDEVRGPGETEWRSLELHPVFADAIAQMETPPPPAEADDTHLDFNPLIDVCLVLLIFFILTATYSTLTKLIEAPTGSDQENEDLPTVTETKLRELAITVKIDMSDSGPVFMVEKEPVDAKDLEETFKNWVAKSGRAKVALEVDALAPWWTVIAVRDAATGAKIQEMIRIERPKKK
jgi:biopolymer transport protein ExbD